jgi:hypothetical protein
LQSGLNSILQRVRVVQSNTETTRLGGVTGAGFRPVQSGNPGGRPKGLARRVRELVGPDGEAVAAFMYDVMTDPKARTADRLEAGRWLADRGFGRADQVVDLGLTRDDFFEWLKQFSLEDIDAMWAIIEKYPSSTQESAASTAELPAMAGR